MASSTDEQREFALQQYAMLEAEALEIHARSDRLEQLFVTTYGAVYAYYFSQSSDSKIFFLLLIVPIFISGFAVSRLELLSHVRRIIRSYQREIERALPADLGDADGKVHYFNTKFYKVSNDHTDLGDISGISKFFWKGVSDRAKLWKWLFWLSILVFFGVSAWIGFDSLCQTKW